MMTPPAVACGGAPGGSCCRSCCCCTQEGALFEKLTVIMQRVAERVADSYRHGGKPIRIKNPEEKIFLHVEGKNACTRCRIGEQEIAVSVDGRFFPCSRLVGEGDNPELNFGNVVIFFAKPAASRFLSS